MGPLTAQELNEEHCLFSSSVMILSEGFNQPACCRNADTDLSGNLFSFEFLDQLDEDLIFGSQRFYTGNFGMSTKGRLRQLPHYPHPKFTTASSACGRDTHSP